MFKERWNYVKKKKRKTRKKKVGGRRERIASGKVVGRSKR